MNDNEILVEFGRNLKAERVRRGFNQENLAEIAEIPHFQSIGEIERGEVNTSLIRIARLLKALDLRFEDLLDISKLQ